MEQPSRRPQPFRCAAATARPASDTRGAVLTRVWGSTTAPRGPLHCSFQGRQQNVTSRYLMVDADGVHTWENLFREGDRLGEVYATRAIEYGSFQLLSGPNFSHVRRIYCRGIF